MSHGHKKKSNAAEATERRRLKLAALMADPATAPNALQAAKLLGVNRKTIARDLETIKPVLKETDGLIEEYKTLLKKRMPIPDRVSLYEDIARKSTNPFAQLKALERVDELSGVITDSEAMKARKNDEASKPAPMFVFPAGTQIDFGGITINQQIRPQDDQPPMRNITPKELDAPAESDESTDL